MPRWSSTWATATAGRAAIATRSTRSARTGSASTRPLGGDDSAHQYFGEGAVGSQIRLAKNAVVLLHHLCYASGLSEPGLPEGSLDVGRQRVDNYAAGFVRAGAAAVIADAWSSPSYLVRSILGGRKSIQAAWQSSPNANGNLIAFESRRSPGYIAQMDMETPTSGFSRSIVMKTGLAPADVLAGASGSLRGPTSFGPVIPSLAGTGIKLATPAIAGLPSAGSATTIDVPFTIANRAGLPAGIQASVRLDPIAVAAVPAAPGDPATPVEPTDPASTRAGRQATGGQRARRPGPHPTRRTEDQAPDPCAGRGRPAAHPGASR